MFEQTVHIIDQAVSDGACSCAALAIGQGNILLKKVVRGKIRLPNGPQATLQTRFDMASLTKVLSTTMIALLAIDGGKLCLWDPISRFFPVDKDKESISIFHLLTHTSGLLPHIMLEDTITSPGQAVDCILKSALIHDVGAVPDYSCMGFIVLGRILESIYGKPLDILAKEMVFAPLGMMSTGYLPHPGNIAATEIDPSTGNAFTGIVHDENARFLNGVSGNAGVFSNLEDFITFAAMLASGGGFKGKPFLSPAVFKIAIQNYTLGADVHRGLGFHLAGTPANFMGDLFPPNSFGHTGFTGTSLAIDPDTGFYVALLTNRVHPSRDNLQLMRIRRQLHNAAYSEFSMQYA